MKFENKKYIAELNFKSLGRGLATGALVGTGLFGGIVTGAKMAGVGRFAPQNSEQTIQQKPVEVKNTNTITNQVSEPTTTTQQQTAVQQKSNFEFESEHMKKLYGALVSAEHRGNVKDPHIHDPKHYIRNKVTTASTAYGPAQITVSTAKGYVDLNNPYHKAFIEQGKKFLKSTKENKTYGLGAKGELSEPKYHDDYQQLTSAVMKGKAKELGIDITKQLSKDDLNKFIQHWRHGIKSKNKPEKWYSSTIHNYYYGN